MALWGTATRLQAAWQHAPRLATTGPVTWCGKSRLLDVVTETVHAPLTTVNASPAAIFRSITDDEPLTLLVGEADTIFGSVKVADPNEDLRGLPNAVQEAWRRASSRHLRILSKETTAPLPGWLS